MSEKRKYIIRAVTLGALGKVLVVLVDKHAYILAPLDRAAQVEGPGIAEHIAHKQHAAIAGIGLSGVEEIGRLALRADKHIPSKGTVGSIDIPVGYRLKHYIDRLHRYALIVETVATGAEKHCGGSGDTRCQCDKKLIQSVRKVSRTGRRPSEESDQQ